MNLEDVLTTSEAAEKWGLGKATVKQLCLGQKGFPPRLLEGVEYRKSGNTWLVTAGGMERLYGTAKQSEKLIKKCENMIVAELLEGLRGFKPDSKVYVCTKLGTNTKFGINRAIISVSGCIEMSTNKWSPVIHLREE